MFVSNALERIEKTVLTIENERESNISKRKRLSKEDLITIHDLNRPMWRKCYNNMENFTDKVVQMVRARTNEKLRAVCFHVGTTWFNTNLLHQQPTLFSRRKECKASKHTSPVGWLIRCIDHPSLLIVYSSLLFDKMVVQQNVFALMRWIVLFNGEVQHTPRLVGIGETENNIEVSVLAPLSPIVAWIHYATVFPQYVDHIKSLDTRTITSNVAQRAGLDVVEEWKSMVQEKRAMMCDEIIRRLGWPLWLLQHTQRLMSNMYALFSDNPNRFPLMAISHRRVKQLRVVAVVFDSIGEENIAAVLG